MFLILVLFRNPVVFVKTVGFGFMCLFDLERYLTYINPLTSSLALREGIEHGLGQDYPFHSRRTIILAYNAAHVFARTELYKAGRELALHGSRGRYVWRKFFGPITPGESEMYGLASITNTITGYCSLSQLGISGDRARIEEILLFPRYIHLLFRFLFDGVLRGGIRGNEARVLLACLLAGSLVLNWLF